MASDDHNVWIIPKQARREESETTGLLDTIILVFILWGSRSRTAVQALRSQFQIISDILAALFNHTHLLFTDNSPGQMPVKDSKAFYLSDRLESVVESLSVMTNIVRELKQGSRVFTISLLLLLEEYSTVHAAVKSPAMCHAQIRFLLCMPGTHCSTFMVFLVLNLVSYCAT